MLSALGFGTILALLLGIAVFVALTVRAGSLRADGTIARVLYEAEHPEQRR